jgi:hypothetical protein
VSSLQGKLIARKNQIENNTLLLSASEKFWTSTCNASLAIKLFPIMAQLVTKKTQ